MTTLPTMDKATQYELHLAQRMSRLGTETAFEVLNKARALERSGKILFTWKLANLTSNTPKNVVEAGIDALEGGTHYGPTGWLAGIASGHRRGGRSRPAASKSPATLLLFLAVNQLFFSLFSLWRRLEMRSSIPSPGFPIYESMINYAGAQAVPIRLREEKDFGFDVDEMASLITDRTRLIILNSPQNPTGGVLGKQDFHDIAATIGDRNIMVLSDEIYSRLVFEGEHYSIMSVPGFQERTILLDGFSKTYAMTGWRMGYGVMRPDLAAHITRLMTNSNSCTASFTQIAGIEAIRGDQSSVDRMRAAFKGRRDVFVAGLNRIKGFSCRMPKGAFYAFPNITKTGWKSKALADALLEQAGVAALSGASFGDYGEGYLRFSVANSLENLNQALERIDGWTKHKM